MAEQMSEGARAALRSRPTRHARSMPTAMRAMPCARPTSCGQVATSGAPRTAGAARALCRARRRAARGRTVVGRARARGRTVGSAALRRSAAQPCRVLRLLGSRERAAAARAAAADAFTGAGALAEAVEVRLLLAWDHDYLAGESVFDVLDAAERDAERASRDDLLARVRALRGHMLARRGQFDEGAALAAQALVLVRASGPPSAIFDVYWSVAAIGVTRADDGGAVAALEEAAELCRATGLRRRRGVRASPAWPDPREARRMGPGRSSSRARCLPRTARRPSGGARCGLLASCWSSAAWVSEGRPLLQELACHGLWFRHTPSLVEGLHGLAFADEIDGSLSPRRNARASCSTRGSRSRATGTTTRRPAPGHPRSSPRRATQTT